MVEHKIEFLPIQERHIPLMLQWMRQPHIAEFWQETEHEEQFRQKYLIELPKRGVSPFIIAINSIPIGYIQSYQANKVGGGWWPDAKEGTFGIDQFIGDPDWVGKGFGTKAINHFVQDIFMQSKVSEIITDPEPKNKKAIHVYEKVGFKAVGEINTPGGKALLMKLKRE